MKTIFSLIILISSVNLSAQTSYNDVAVIVNTNSNASILIGSYFQTARNIPDQNMIYISTSTAEDIDSSTFESLRSQVENHLLSNNLVNSINYLVTTKGVPLSVNRGCVIDPTISNKCASVDSELTLILGSFASSIGQANSILNPYFDSHANFSRQNEGFYLVTRLDGYEVPDIYNLIDNSGPDTGINPNSTQSIVDISNAIGNDSSYFVGLYTPTYDSLQAGGWNALFDSDTLPVLNQSNVLGYYGLGHGPLPSATFNYEWTKGSVASMSMCNSAFTFDLAANTTNGVLIADLIADGCTAAMGNVDYIYFSQIAPTDIFVNRYYDPVNNYNLAESFYMMESRLSWQAVIVGDPKASVQRDDFANAPETELEQVSIYPNPSSGFVSVTSDKDITSIEVVDVSGKRVDVSQQEINGEVQLNFYSVQDGVYLILIETGGLIRQERILINH
ncbi:MAG: TIGR03790 family protein [Fluviicola sp.]